MRRVEQLLSDLQGQQSQHRRRQDESYSGRTRLAEVQTQACRQHARDLGGDESADQEDKRGFRMPGLFFAAEDLQGMGRRSHKRVRVIQAMQTSMLVCRSG